MLERHFGIRAAASTVQTEIVGGATTFVTMAYILFVNGLILSGAGLPPMQVLTVTALVAGVTTIAMGLYANYPFALAPGMGINAAVAGSLVATEHLTPAEAMGVILCERIVIALLVVDARLPALVQDRQTGQRAVRFAELTGVDLDR